MAHIFQINASPGGVPKFALPAGEVTTSGLVGDRQRDTRHHGGPQRALCIFSLERILALQSEGHPIYPGAIGENVTLSGVDWEWIQPGACLRLGKDVEIEVTSFVVPFNNIQGAFQDGRIARVSQKVYPGWSRAYVRILHAGRIIPGDPVQFLYSGA